MQVSHVRKPPARFWFGDILFMASRAEHSRIRQLRHYRSRILGVLGERTVAGFAVHARVFPSLLHLQHVAMAIFTGVVTGIRDRLRRKFSQRISPIVAVLSKALGNEVRSQQQKYGEPNYKRSRQPDKMFGIFEFAHMHPSGSICHPCRGSEW
jgi:hypothetical protein